MLKFVGKKGSAGFKLEQGMFLVYIDNNGAGKVFHVAFVDSPTLPSGQAIGLRIGLRYVLSSLATGERWTEPMSLEKLEASLDKNRWRVLGDVELREI